MHLLKYINIPQYVYHLNRLWPDHNRSWNTMMLCSLTTIFHEIPWSFAISPQSFMKYRDPLQSDCNLSWNTMILCSLTTIFHEIPWFSCCQTNFQDPPPHIKRRFPKELSVNMPGERGEGVEGYFLPSRGWGSEVLFFYLHGGGGGGGVWSLFSRCQPNFQHHPPPRHIKRPLPNSG